MHSQATNNEFEFNGRKVCANVMFTHKYKAVDRIKRRKKAKNKIRNNENLMHRSNGSVPLYINEIEINQQLCVASLQRTATRAKLSLQRGKEKRKNQKNSSKKETATKFE